MDFSVGIEMFMGRSNIIRIEDNLLKNVVVVRFMCEIVRWDMMRLKGLSAEVV